MESDNIFKAMLVFLVFSFISVVIITISIIYLASVYDYGYYELDTFIQGNTDILANGTAQVSTDLSNTLYNTIFWIDKAWTLSAVMYIMFLFIYSYHARRENMFTFGGFLYIGILLFTVLLGIYLNISDWFYEEILQNLIPNIVTILPNFTWWLQNAGFVTILIMLGLVLINIVDLDFARFNFRKKKEQDNEVL